MFNDADLHKNVWIQNFYLHIIEFGNEMVNISFVIKPRTNKRMAISICGSVHYLLYLMDEAKVSVNK